MAKAARMIRWSAACVTAASGLAALGVSVASSVGAQEEPRSATVSCAPNVFIQEETLFGGSAAESPKELAATAVRNQLQPGLDLASTSTTEEGSVQFSYSDSKGDVVALITAAPTVDGGWVLSQVLSCANLQIDHGGEG